MQPGSPGYFEAGQQVRRLEVPTRLDRAEARRQPDIQTDPRNIARVGVALRRRMAELDQIDAAVSTSDGGTRRSMGSLP
jgi:zinc/manganese transport system substrate-binding protein